MNAKVATLAVAVLLVLAGCSGSGGTTTDSPPPTGTDSKGTQLAGSAERSTTETTHTPTTAEPGDHLATNGEDLNASTLLRKHLTALSQSKSFTVVYDRTVTYVENGTVRTRGEVINRGDLENQRHRIDRRSVGMDGRVQFDETRYANATVTCLVSRDRTQCRDSGVDSGRIVALTVETTPLETIAAPDYSPDGVVNRDGQSLYRYSASSFRSPLPSGTESELYGEDPSFVDATLLVHPSGRIVEHALTYRLGGDPQQTLEVVYSAKGINATSVMPPRAIE